MNTGPSPLCMQVNFCKTSLAKIHSLIADSVEHICFCILLRLAKRRNLKPVDIILPSIVLNLIFAKAANQHCDY